MDRAVSHYMDGVTVKISEKYRPPRKITLPPGLTQLEPSDIFADDYECIAEDTALGMIAEMRKRRDEILNTRKQTIESEEKVKEEQAKLRDVEETSRPAELETEEPLTPQPVYQNAVAEVPNLNGPSTNFHTFLQPTKSTFTSTPKEPEKPVETKRNFNLEDFEGYSTPFEEMELKTLNDKAELALVLQPTLSIEPQNITSETYSTTYSNATWNSVPYQPVPYSNVSSWMPYSTQLYPSDQTFYRSPAVGSDFASSNPVSLRQAKSVPDLSEMESQLNRASASSSALGAPAQPAVKHEKRLSSRTPPPRLSGLSSSKPIVRPVPNPPANLDVAGVQLFRQFTDMGFPRDRVLEALQKYNDDEKQILDHLVLVQTWEEKGYTSKAIGAAIAALGFQNTSLLEKHLQLHGQLSALGFAEERISAALVAAEHDRDKAIDILLQ